MRSSSRLRWAGSLVALFALGAAPGCVGCSSERGDDPSAPGPDGVTPAASPEAAPLGADGLRARFPAQAARVLDADRAFVATAAGFAPALDPPGPASLSPPFSPAFPRVAPHSATGVARPHSELRASLPQRGEDALVFELPGAASDPASPAHPFSVRVRERAARGAGALEGGAVAYPRENGTSFWSAQGQGYEEWLHVRAAREPRDRAVAAWEIDGAEPRVVGDAVELFDARGVSRIRVAAPEAFAQGGRRVVAHLDVRGHAIELRVDADGDDRAEMLIDPSWTATGSTSVPHAYHAYAVLPSGKLLVAGGITTNTFQATSVAELYDPQLGTWSATGSMPFAAEGVAFALLAGGSFVVAGGATAAGGCESNTQVYDPVAGTWKVGETMPASVCYARGVALTSGKLLVAGGFDASTNALTTANVYDPSTDTWSHAAAMGAGRFYGTLTRLPDGRVLATGGANGIAATAQASAEIYDPVSDAWSAAPTMSEIRMAQTATLLPDGRVLVAGGAVSAAVSGVTASAEIYDPATGAWSPAGSMSVARSFHAAALVGDEVLVVGGVASGPVGTGSVERYDVASNTWSSVASLASQRASGTAAYLGNGRVVAAGGYTVMVNGIGTVLASAELIGGATALGGPCATALDCVSGSCADGVCCDTACSAGACDACSVAAGAAVDGTCALFTGPSCDDGNPCTAGDACASGSCAGSAIICAPPVDGCLVQGSCDPATGLCSTPSAADGIACDDANACTFGEVCSAGVCGGGSAVTCVPLDGCHVAGACDPAIGCAKLAAPEGTPCDDGDPCTKLDACAGGVCVGGSPVTCVAVNACSDVGVCDPVTGLCSNPAKADGAPCDDGDGCTTADTCVAGGCTGGVPLVCATPAVCKGAGVCHSLDGACSYADLPDGTACPSADECTTGATCTTGACGGGTAKPDGTPCAGGTCKGGVCGMGTSSSGSTNAGAGGGASSSNGAGGAGGGTSSSSGTGGDGTTTGCSCEVAGASGQRGATGGMAGVALAIGLVLARRRSAASRLPSSAAGSSCSQDHEPLRRGRASRRDPTAGPSAGP